MVESVRFFTSEKLMNALKTEERQMLHGVIKACTYKLDDDQSLNFIRKLLGISTGTFYKSIGGETEDTTDPASYCHIERNKRQASSTLILQKESILCFCHSDDSLTIDSNSKRIVEVKIADKVEKYVGRVWAVLTIDEQYSLFVESELVE